MRSSRRRALAFSCLLVLSAAGLSATDLTGTWIGTLPQRGRIPTKDVAIRFVHEGSKLAGKVYNDAGASDAIVEGTVNGNQMSFAVETLEQSGNQINIVLYRYIGSVDGGWVDLTRERAAARDASSGNVVPVRREWDSDEQDRQRRFHSFRLELLFR